MTLLSVKGAVLTFPVFGVFPDRSGETWLIGGTIVLLLILLFSSTGWLIPSDGGVPSFGEISCFSITGPDVSTSGFEGELSLILVFSKFSLFTTGVSGVLMITVGCMSWLEVKLFCFC